MLEIKVAAKINWTLDILGKRDDGYHEMDMLMHSVGLYDTLGLARAEGLTLQFLGGPPLRVDEHNLVLRAALALQEEIGASPGATITLSKRIPVGAGMGGGSADAAAALVGLSLLWGLSLPQETISRLALGLGADVPFFLRGGLQRVRGVGEVLTPLEYRRDFWLVIIHPGRGLSTREIFAAFDTSGTEALERPNTGAAQNALQRGDAEALAVTLGNVMEPISVRERPEIERARQDLLSQGALAARMTGSGSAVFGLFTGAKAARIAWKALRPVYRRCFMAPTTRCAITVQE